MKPAEKEHDGRHQYEENEALQQSTRDEAAHQRYPQNSSTGLPIAISRLADSLLPRLLVGTRNTLEHVAQLVPAWDGRELADLLCC